MYSNCINIYGLFLVVSIAKIGEVKMERRRRWVIELQLERDQRLMWWMMVISGGSMGRNLSRTTLTRGNHLIKNKYNLI